MCARETEMFCNTLEDEFHTRIPLLLKTKLEYGVVTRDDVVSQRLKFGSAFLSSSWESKIAVFF